MAGVSLTGLVDDNTHNESVDTEDTSHDDGDDTSHDEVRSHDTHR